MFRNILIALMLLCVSSVALANTQPVTGEEISKSLNQEIALMSDTEKAKVLTQIKSGDLTSKFRTWTEIGEGIGSGLVATAEKLGIAVNDFANTPVGKLVLVLIVWNYMGSQIVLIMTGLGLLFIGNYAIYSLAKKLFGKYDEKGKFVNFDIDNIRCSDGTYMSLWLAALIFTALGIIFIVSA